MIRRAGWLLYGAVPLLGLALAPGWVMGPAAHAESEAPCSETVLRDTGDLAPSRAVDNPPLERMHVPAAREIADGTGVRVVVIDSGIEPQPAPGVAPASATSLPGLDPVRLSGHGTLVSGLIAGEEGVAPGAEILDVRVFDTAEADVVQGHRDVTARGIAEGIRQAIALHRAHPVHVVTIALSVSTDDPVLRRAIRDLLVHDVVVVASAGDASDDDASAEGPSADEGASFEGTPDSDAPVYPADYPGVLAVSAVAPPGGSVIGSVVPNRDTDVAAPTVGAISVNANGQRCDIEQVAASWAAAEVSGVVALLRSHFRGESAEQVVARLVASAEGSERVRSPWTGAGVVQAHDALTRSLAPGRSGEIVRSVAQDRVDATPPLPQQRPDLLGPSRTLLLWAGLGGGALLALALLLRPLNAARRPNAKDGGV